VGDPPLAQSKHNMADGRHLEYRYEGASAHVALPMALYKYVYDYDYDYDVIFQRRMFRFGLNSAAGCRMIRRLRENGRDRNRK